ncbi:MAG: PilZ domain-containing protein [Candidatus Aquilonibacter sp.]
MRSVNAFPIAAHVEFKTDNGLTRASVRVAVDVELRYAQPGGPVRTARALNISTGGVHMNADDDIPVGAAIELDIPLGGAQRIKVHGRIVAHQASGPNYNVAFYEMTSEAHESIARFIEGQSSRRRKRKVKLLCMQAGKHLPT